VHIDRSAGALLRPRERDGLVITVPAQMNLHPVPAMPPHRVLLQARRRTRHIDARRNIQRMGRQRHALRVISRRRREHTPRDFLARKHRHPVAGAAPFVALDRRKILALEPDFRPRLAVRQIEPFQRRGVAEPIDPLPRQQRLLPKLQGERKGVAFHGSAHQSSCGRSRPVEAVRKSARVDATVERGPNRGPNPSTSRKSNGDFGAAHELVASPSTGRVTALRRVLPRPAHRSASGPRKRTTAPRPAHSNGLNRQNPPGDTKEKDRPKHEN
jgi:hypothetical protein